jgi:DNA-binding GntR family transcriptional regulator
VPRNKLKTASSSTPPAPTRTARRTHALTGDEVYSKLQQAVFEHRLMPGTKLIEERMAEEAGLSRTVIRPILARLAHEKLVTLIPNRGAFIASPTEEEAREVFAVRRLIEPAVVQIVSANPTQSRISRLRELVKQEEAARAVGDRHSIIRLSGEFHLLMAELTGNQTVLRILREMCAQTCLVIALYDTPNTSACPHHEHDDIVDLIERGDGEKAANAMLEHLNHIERALDFGGKTDKAIDWRAIFTR